LFLDVGRVAGEGEGEAVPVQSVSCWGGEEGGREGGREGGKKKGRWMMRLMEERGRKGSI
jgi:hypothetical protein